MNVDKIVDFLAEKIESQKTYFPESKTEYTEREMRRALNTLRGRALGAWKEVDAPCVDTAVDRICWLLDGSFGAGEAFTGWTWIIGNLHGKKGKNVDRAWLAIGRELTIYSAFLDNSEYTPRKICEVWKKAGVDFNAVNERAALVVKSWIYNEMGGK